MTQPAAHVSPSSLWAVMCGTLKRSRTSRMPLRGTFSTLHGHCPFVPNFSDLKSRWRSALVTSSNFGVSASYIFAWRSAPEGTGTLPSWPEGMMLSAVEAKSVVAAEAPAGRSRQSAAAARAARARGLDMGRHPTPRTERTAPGIWTPAATLTTASSSG